jgi:hypothetical protein
MWVIVKKFYAGLLGVFPGDMRHDLDEKVIIKLRKKLGKENVIDTCAPEDEQKDINVELKNQASDAITLARELRAKAERCLGEELRLKKEHVAAGELCTKTRHQVNAASQDSSEADLTKLSRDQKTNVAALHIAYGRMEIAVGEAILAEMEAQNAERKAAELAEKAGIKFEPAVKTKAAGNAQG